MKKITIYVILVVTALGSVAEIDAMSTSIARQARQGYRGGTRQIVRNAPAQPSWGQRFYSYWFSGKGSEVANTPTVLATTEHQTKAPTVMPLPISQEVSAIEDTTPIFGLGSWIPGTAASKERQYVSSINEVLDKMQKDGVTQESINQYKKRRREYMDLTGKDFNPIATKSSLLVNQSIKDLTYINANDNGLFPKNNILEQLYNLGVRVSSAEAGYIIKKSGWDIRAKKIANMVNTIKDSEKLTIQDIGYVASLVASTYRIFQVFGVDIAPYFGRTLNIKDMQWLSDAFLEIQEKTDQNVFTGIISNGEKQYKNARADIYPISYFNQNVPTNNTHLSHFSGESRPSRPDYLQYPTGYSRISSQDNTVASFVRYLKQNNYGETFLAKAKQAGFFESGVGLTALPSYGASSSARNTLIRELGLPHDASYETIKDAFYEFSKKAALDVTRDITGPLYIKLKTEINPAWNDYNAELAKAKNEQLLATE